MFGWLQKRKLAKVSARQHRWIVHRLSQYAGKLYDAPSEDARYIGKELLKLMSELPPPDFK